MAALVWPIMALLVPIYTLGGLVLTAAVSAGVYFAGTKALPYPRCAHLRALRHRQ